MDHGIDFAAKRDEYDYLILHDLALLELLHRDRGYFQESGLVFKKWIDSVLPTLGHTLPINPLDEFEGKQLTLFRYAVTELCPYF